MCEQRACLNKEKAEVNPATQYVHIDDQTLHVCGSCANKLAVQHGIKEDPKLRLSRPRQDSEPKQLRISWL